MVTLREAVQKALADIDAMPYWNAETLERIESDLRQALEAEQQAEQQGEPVAWKHDCDALCMGIELWIARCPHCGRPRSAHQQPAQQPLTDEQKLMCWSRATHDADVYHKTQHQCLMDYGAEIEAAHGIK